VANIVLRAQFLIQASRRAERPSNNRNWPLLSAQHRRPLTHKTPDELLRGRRQWAAEYEVSPLQPNWCLCKLQRPREGLLKRGMQGFLNEQPRLRIANLTFYIK